MRLHLLIESDLVCSRAMYCYRPAHASRSAVPARLAATRRIASAVPSHIVPLLAALSGAADDNGRGAGGVIPPAAYTGSSVAAADEVAPVADASWLQQ